MSFENLTKPINAVRPYFLLWLLLTCNVLAGPSIAPGDLALRQDIQRLADHGALSGPVTTWPLSWGPILSDLQNYRSTERWFAATVLMLSYR